MNRITDPHLEEFLTWVRETKEKVDSLLSDTNDQKDIPITDFEVPKLIEAGEMIAAGEKELYFILNTLVPQRDGSRIIGPLTRAQIELKKQSYEHLMSRFPEESKEEYPFLVYGIELH